jgi:hypothetical protein
LLLVGLFGGRPGAFGLRLRFPQGAAALAQGVEVIQLVADRWPLKLFACGVDAGQAVLDAQGAVADEVLEVGQLPQFFGPLFAVAAWTEPARNPALTLGLDDHEHGFASEEDLVGGSLADSGTCLLVEDLEQGRGTQGGRATVPPQLGDAGGGITQEDGQEPAGDGQADALGLGAGGEVGLRVGGDFDTAASGVLQRPKALQQLGDLVAEQGELSLLWCGVEVAQGTASLAVQALAREAALLGIPGDIAAPPEEDG